MECVEDRVLGESGPNQHLESNLRDESAAGVEETKSPPSVDRDERGVCEDRVAKTPFVNSHVRVFDNTRRRRNGKYTDNTNSEQGPLQQQHRSLREWVHRLATQIRSQYAAFLFSGLTYNSLFQFAEIRNSYRYL